MKFGLGWPGTSIIARVSRLRLHPVQILNRAADGILRKNLPFLFDFIINSDLTPRLVLELK